MTIDEIRRDNDWGDSRKFCEADEPTEIAGRLIAEIPDHTEHRNLQYAEIMWLYTSKALKDRGRSVVAKATKVSELAQAMMVGDSDEGVPDFVVVVSADKWEGLTEQQQAAVVDHELCHMYMADCAIPTLLPHDLQEFRGVVERHGLYTSSLSMMAASMQMSLPGMASAQTALAAMDNLAREGNATVTLSSGDKSVTFGGAATHLELPERDVVKADPDDPESLDCTIIKHELTPEQRGQMDTMLANAAV